MTQVELGDLLARHRGGRGCRRVVMIQCVGSRNEKNLNCSRICCQSAVKNALELKKLNPEDGWSSPLPGHAHLRPARGLLHRGPASRASSSSASSRTSRPQVRAEAERRCRAGERPRAAAGHRDPGRPAGAERRRRARPTPPSWPTLMKLNRNPEGFFIEAHVKLRPVDMPSEGVYLCGTAHGPKLISETIAQAQAAAGARVDPAVQGPISSRRSRPKSRPTFASMPHLRAVLPVRGAAVQPDRRRSSRSTRPCATGCGVCTAVCPRQTINLSFYEDDQIVCKIEALLERGGGLMPGFEPTIVAFCCEY